MSVYLNLGCGKERIKGYINIDKDEKFHPDLVRDVERGLPFADNSVDEVYTSHFLEHVKDLVFVMDEIWRVCKPDALVKIKVPYGLSTWGVRDPTHVRFFVEDSFQYFDRSTELGMSTAYGSCNFKIVKCERIAEGLELNVELLVVK